MQMKPQAFRSIACLVFLMSYVAAGLGQTVGRPVEAVLWCEGFELPDSVGKMHSLADADTKLKVIAFLGTECPLAKLYGPRLSQLGKDFAGEVSIFGVNSNSQDSLAEITAYVRRHKLQFPVLKDLNAHLADQLRAERTPEVFLLDAENKIRYHGRIDDQYGVGYLRKAPTREDLKEAIQELISGDEVTIPETETVGCIVGRPAKRVVSEEVTYSADVAAILQKHCVECHREGQIAPFALTNYDEVIGWSETIREVVKDGRMPPWHADPAHGTFSNDRSMPVEDKQLLLKWIKNGVPKGDARLPEAVNYVDGWHLPREPDQEVVISNTPFRVPAQGVVEYQYFVVDPKFEEDKWIAAAEIVPGNRDVVHHAIVFVRPPEGERQSGMGWLTAFVPGQSLLHMGEGMARRIPKGSKLVFQMHYTPTGTEAEDLTKLGLIFADPANVHTEVLTRIVINRDFEIPPQDSNYEVELSTDEFPRGSQLLAIVPHMHFRGSKFTVFSKSREMDDKILLHVPNYDFNWQHSYVLSEPMPLDNVQINCRAVFDNSSNNLANPDPSLAVRWGDQTWEEMAMAYLAISVPRQQAKDNSNDRVLADATILSESRSGQSSSKKLTLKQREARAQEFAKAFFEKLDQNQDGEILRAETPSSFRAFAWRFYDLNNDGKLKWNEVLYQARLSQRPK